MGNPVCWFEIYVNDMPRAKAFYETVLGITLEKLEMPEEVKVPDLEMWTFPNDFEKHGATGALAKMEGFPAGNSSVLIYFSCEDCAVEESRVEKAGGKIQQTKMSIGQHGFISMIIDTEGNMIGLHSKT